MKTKISLTKKDCLVVFICAGFGLMSLGAIGSGGREMAKYMVCKSNLKKWGVSSAMFTIENDGYFPFALDCFSLPYGHPNYIPKPNDPPRSQGSDWACRWHDEAYNNVNHPELAGALWPYLQNQKVAMCPSFNRISENRGENHYSIHNPGIPVEPQYSYSQNFWLGPVSADPYYGSMGAVQYEAPKIQDVINPANVLVFAEENMWTIPGSSGATLNDTALITHWFGTAGNVDCIATYHKTALNFGNDGTLLKKGVSNIVLVDGHTDTGYYLDSVDLSDPKGWKRTITNNPRNP